MRFNPQLVIDILLFIRDDDNVSFYFHLLPGDYSNQEIAFHVEHCLDQGLLKGRMSGDRIMAEVGLTLEGHTRIDGL